MPTGDPHNTAYGGCWCGMNHFDDAYRIGYNAAHAATASLDVERLSMALDRLDDGSCGNPDCCGVQPWPDAAAIAREYAALESAAPNPVEKPAGSDTGQHFRAALEATDD